LEVNDHTGCTDDHKILVRRHTQLCVSIECEHPMRLFENPGCSIGWLVAFGVIAIFALLARNGRSGV
jgi:hypothetical protein